MPVSRFSPIARYALRGFCTAAVIFTVAACTPRVDPRGNLPDEERLAEIVPGEHTREEVGEILGTPSTIGDFGGETWIYISEQTETLAFFEPEVTERQVLILRFDTKGVVASIEKLGVEDGQVLEPVERTTPTEGNTITIMEQLLGNFGRFNRK